MITRADVADLQPGDVVELVRHWIDETTTTIRGQVRPYHQAGLVLGQGPLLRLSDGGVGPRWDSDWTLTVVSHAPRPLYLNHPRTKPVPGDVVRDADNGSDRRTWMYRSGTGCPWVYIGHELGILWGSCKRELLPSRLRLLVDGETGQVVP